MLNPIILQAQYEVSCQGISQTSQSYVLLPLSSKTLLVDVWSTCLIDLESTCIHNIHSGIKVQALLGERPQVDHLRPFDH